MKNSWVTRSQGLNVTKSVYLCVMVTLCLLFMTTSAWAATYYLDANIGNDNNVGTSAAPWKTLSKAQSKVVSGDIVIVRNGSYGIYTETRTNRTDWITYQADAGHAPELTQIFIDDYGGGSTINAYLCFDGFTIRPAPAQARGVFIRDAQYLKFLNLNFIGQSKSYLGIESWPGLYGSRYITIDHCTFSGGTKTEMFEGFNTAIDLTADYLTITNNDITQIMASPAGGGLGISVGCVNGTISGNDIHHTTADACIGIGGGNGPLVIENNKLHDLYIYKPVLTETPTATTWSADGLTMTNPSANWNTAGVNFIDASMEVVPVSGTNVLIGEGEKFTVNGDSGDFGVASVSADGHTIVLTKSPVNGGQPSNVNYYIKSRTHIDLIQAYAYSMTANLTFRGNQFYDFGEQCCWINTPNAGMGGSNFIFENNLVWNSYADGLDEYWKNVHFGYIDGLTIRNNTIIGKLSIDNSNHVALHGNVVGYIEVDSSCILTSNDYNIFCRGGVASPNVIGPHTIFLFPGYSWDKWNNPAFTSIFVNYANGNFQLASSGSIAVGHADPSNYAATDILGNPRDAQPDAGCYEYGSESAVMYGDVDGDDEISAYDAALTAQAAVGLITLTAEQTRAADVSGEGEVSAYDAALIAQRAVGLITKFPVEG